MLSEAQYKGPVCRGSWALGNNCKICERCIATKPTNPRPPMTEITHEALEALNQRSLEAQQTYRACSGLSDLATMIDAHNAFGSALIDLYRTGQLILAQPIVEITERQSETLHKALIASCSEFVEPIVLAQPSGDEVEAVALYRHKKRGTVYEVLGEGVLQCAANPALDEQPVVIYRGEDGKLWVRGVVEFHDGRFEPITTLDAHRGKQACLKARENSDG